jgi:hypothetical protein
MTLFKERITLYKNEHVEVVLIRWPVGFISPMHGHPGLDCTIHHMSGTLYEHRDNGACVVISKENPVSRIDDAIGKHIIETVESASSVHVYSKL